ncbi:FMN-binding protein [Sulfurovum riftiae]|uniref:FMN-binding domain-containing protein n=1 Tax=Sulfurovum riftiae TaxID=1630136 RepID=A0A151CIF2_9BACT|nr:FMN-binding protein [Sulfurovum riftiae]KYJ87315.1 hypothetical protein AS592_09325 [Sulfurovum riftiae]
MKKRFITLLLSGAIFCAAMEAAVPKPVKHAIDASFGEVSKIEARQIVLTGSTYEKVKARAKAKLETKIYRYYVIRSSSAVGYAVLITRKVRTKKATVLYVFDVKGVLKFSEIMAFGEPPEYIPNTIWMGQFRSRNSAAPLKMGKDIPTISGATLSARTISDGARIARAILQTAIVK